MEEVNRPVDPDELIARLEKLIEFFEKHKFIIQNHNEKECPDPLAHRKRGIRESAKTGN